MTNTDPFSLSDIAFGNAFGFIKASGDVGGLIKGWHDGLLAFALLRHMYPLTALLKKTPLRRFLVANPGQNFGIGVMMQFRDKLIAERAEELAAGKIEKGGRVDLLQQ